MAQRTCACGRSLPEPGPGGGRPRTKCEVCSPPRRKPASRASTGTVQPAQLLPWTAPAAADRGSEPLQGALVAESVYAATLGQLTTADRANTAAGAAALALARQLDAGVPTAASVSNALLKALDAALADARQSQDELDELAARRSAKASSAR